MWLNVDSDSKYFYIQFSQYVEDIGRLEEVESSFITLQIRPLAMSECVEVRLHFHKS